METAEEQKQTTQDEFNIWDESPESSPNAGQQTKESTPAVKAEDTPTSENQQAKTQEAASQQQAPLTPDAIAEAVERGLRSGQPQQQQEEPELTQEQIDEMLRKAKYSVDDLKALGLAGDDLEADVADQRVAALHSIIQRAVDQALAGANLITQHHLQEVNQRFEPVLTTFQQQRQKEMVDSFYKEYPALQDHEEIVQTAALMLKNGGQLTGKTVKEASQLVATQAAALIKKYGGVDLDLSKATQQSQASTPAASAVPKPAQVGSGGRSQTSGMQTPEAAGASEFDIYQRD